ncbi:DNA-binding response regulator [Veronia nyctiphanis]|uniref:DNA-binding response regulator n=1 Tax=Veronia nyctiphanis TaxID=1278244 RepID=A0A4Q0Z051_9GAMM|nr:LytTR family DNA-binding domain-containing protein [Veronia nyctiphanis]RXJ74799.1 DNA-binding response regulator [Veronia nyctiphanis]
MTQTFSAVLAEDEPLLLRHLDKLLADLWPELVIEAKCKNGSQAHSTITEIQPDVVFLDINMPGLDGLQLAEKIGQLKRPPYIVFTTAYSEHALEAFEKNAVDYLLKPLDESRLLKACEKVKTRLLSETKTSDTPDLHHILKQLQAGVASPATKEPLKWIRAARGEDIHLVSVDDVAFFKAEDKYISVYCPQQEEKLEEYIIRTSLKELASQLDQDNFWQIHRSTIINIRKLSKVKKDFTGKMHALVCGQKLPVSRASQALFKGM